jgi:hypothetical protein
MKLIEQAKQEPVKGITPEVREAVVELRAKGFSWRAISKWLAERGVHLSYTQLYRDSQQRRSEE